MSAILADFDQARIADLLAGLPEPVPGRHMDVAAGSIWENDLPAVMEEFFDLHHCFVNGLTGRRCSLGAYMTVVDYRAVRSALMALNVDRLGREDWRRLVRHFRQFNYLAPTFGVLAACLAQELGLPAPLVDSPATDAFYAA